MEKSMSCFVPSGTFLVNLAPAALSEHRLTHIIYTHNLYGKILKLQFKFTNCLLSPVKGTYKDGGPHTKEVVIPPHPEITSLVLNT